MNRVCPYCGQVFSAAGAALGEVSCPHCGQRQDAPAGPAPAPDPGEPWPGEQEPWPGEAEPWPPPAGPAPGPKTQAGARGPKVPPPPPPPLAWEGEGLFISRLLRTVVQVAFRPGRSLAPPHPRGPGYSLGFALVWGCLIWGLRVLWGAASGHYPTVGMALVQLFALPFLIGFSLMIAAGLAHLGLMATGAGLCGYGATFRVLAYGQALAPLVMLPILGPAIYLVWYLVVAVLGLAAGHGSSRGGVLGGLLIIIASLVVLAALITLAIGGLLFYLGLELLRL